MLKTIIAKMFYYPSRATLAIYGFPLNKKVFNTKMVVDKRRFPYAYIEVSNGNGHLIQLRLEYFLNMPGKLSGKVRRRLDGRLRKGYVKKRTLMRIGACQRCGQCCRDLKCPFIVEKNGVHDCFLHPYWPLNCKTYPITQKDIEDYDCPGFSFEPDGSFQGLDAISDSHFS